MQPIQHLLQNSTLSTSSGSHANQAPNHPAVTASFSKENHDENLDIIHRLFLKLAAIYGNAWRNLYKSPEFLQFSKREWLEALAGFEEKVLYQAVAICRENNPYPPSVPEFIECCKKVRKKDHFFRREPRTAEPDRRVAHIHLDKIKTLLNMKLQ